GAGVDGAGELEGPFAGHFDKAAVAAIVATGCIDGAVEPGRVVGPDDDLAAIAVVGRAGVDDRALVYVRDGRVLDIRLVALEAAADVHLAAAGRARCVDGRAGHEPHAVAGDFDRAAVTVVGARVDGAGDHGGAA